MIACRSILRVDTALKVTNTFVISPSIRYLKRCYFDRVAKYSYKVDTGEASFVGMDRKKQKTVSCVWRKVSTQSSSHEEYEVQNVVAASQILGSINIVDEKFEKEIPVEQAHQTEGKSSLSRGSLLHVEEVEGLKGESTTSAKKNSLSVGYSPSTDRHAVAVEVGASLIRFVKGKWGSTQKMIEDETGVKITLPSSRKEDTIIIEGDSAETVTRASRKIEAIVHEAVNSTRLDYSHFVSLPLAVHPELVDKLVKFQNSILGTSETDQTVIESDSDAEASDEGSDVEELDRETKVAVGVETATKVSVKIEATTEAEAELRSKGCAKQVTVGSTSIPLVSYAPKKSKASALELKTSKLSGLGIERSIFIKPKTFHLTVLMLKLWNKERVEAAAKVLQSVSSKVVDALDSRPLSIRLKGLECMKGSFAKARVIYAPVEEVGGEDRLLRACQVIVDAFVEAGLVLERDAQHKLKLHATLMNARHRKREMGTRRKADFFDAREIANQYGSMEWGEFVITEAHLSERFAYDENGYYHCCASIPFPENMQLD